MATPEQIRIYQLHRRVSLGLGIPQATLAHRRLKGSETGPSSVGNILYTGPGPLQGFAGQFASQTLVWWISMTFLRGEQRADDFAPGVISVPLLQAQIPAIDDNFNLVAIAEDDLVIDPDGATLWVVQNPAMSPDRGYWTFMAEKQR